MPEQMPNSGDAETPQADPVINLESDPFDGPGGGAEDGDSVEAESHSPEDAKRDLLKYHDALLSIVVKAFDVTEDYDDLGQIYNDLQAALGNYQGSLDGVVKSFTSDDALDIFTAISDEIALVDGVVTSRILRQAKSELGRLNTMYVKADIDSKLEATLVNSELASKQLVRAWRKHTALRSAGSAALLVGGMWLGVPGHEVIKGAHNAVRYTTQGVRALVAMYSGSELAGGLHAGHRLGKVTKKFAESLQEGEKNRYDMDSLRETLEEMSLDEVLQDLATLTSVSSERGTAINADLFEAQEELRKAKKEKSTLIDRLKEEYESLSEGKKKLLRYSAPILGLGAAAGGLFVGATLTGAYVGLASLGALMSAVGNVSHADQAFEYTDLAMKLREVAIEKAATEENEREFSSYVEKKDRQATGVKVTTGGVVVAIQAAMVLMGLHADQAAAEGGKGQPGHLPPHGEKPGQTANPTDHPKVKVGGEPQKLSQAQIQHENALKHAREQISQAGPSKEAPLHAKPEGAAQGTGGDHQHPGVRHNATPEVGHHKSSSGMGHHVRNLGRRLAGLIPGNKVNLHLGANQVADHGPDTQRDMATWIVKGAEGKSLDASSHSHIYLTPEEEQQAISQVEHELRPHFNADGTLHDRNILHEVNGELVGEKALEKVTGHDLAIHHAIHPTEGGAAGVESHAGTVHHPGHPAQDVHVERPAVGHAHTSSVDTVSHPAGQAGHHAVEGAPSAMPVDGSLTEGISPSHVESAYHAVTGHDVLGDAGTGQTGVEHLAPAAPAASPQVGVEKFQDVVPAPAAPADNVIERFSSTDSGPVSGPAPSADTGVEKFQDVTVKGAAPAHVTIERFTDVPAVQHAAEVAPTPHASVPVPEHAPATDEVLTQQVMAVREDVSFRHTELLNDNKLPNTDIAYHQLMRRLTVSMSGLVVQHEGHPEAVHDLITKVKRADGSFEHPFPKELIKFTDSVLGDKQHGEVVRKAIIDDLATVETKLTATK